MPGTTDVKSLLLEVDASVELLRRNLTRGDQAVGQFESETRQRLDRMDRRFEQLGGGLRQLPGTISRARAEIASIGTTVERVEGQVRASTSAMRTALLSSTAAIGAALSANQIKNYADGYTRFTNQLKVAGLEGSALADVQQRLFDIAQQNGAPLEAIGTLYGRAAQTGRQLGASQSDLLKFTSAVGAALKIQGGSAEEAQGALLQLSQALGSGTVHAEEFNSVNEGLRPILAAAADASKKYQGNVAALKADVVAGKLSSQEFFQLILGGYDALQAKASKAGLTISASFVVLNNALGRYIGQTDESLSATERLAGGIATLADHLDVIIPALTVIGIGFATRFAVGPVTASIAALAALRAELFASNVVMLEGKTAAAAKAQAALAGAQAEVAAIEATIAVRRADQASMTQSLALIEAQRASALQAQTAMAVNAKLGFGTAVGYGRNDAVRANQDLKAQIVTKRALAAVDAELVAAETALAQAQARAGAAATASAAATTEATIAARAGAAASRLLAGGLTLIGGSVAGGAAVLAVGALVAGILLYRNASAAAEERSKATAAAMVSTAARSRELNAALAETAAQSAAASAGIAQVGSNAATSTGKMLTFAGAVGEAAEKLRQLALARRREEVLNYARISTSADFAADQAQARIAARRPSGSSTFGSAGYQVLSDQDRRDNANDARIIAENRAAAETARAAGYRAAGARLDSRIRESDRVGGRDVDGDLARVTRDLVVARKRGIRSQVESLEAQKYELTQYKAYRKQGLSPQAAQEQASSDASSLRGAAAGAQADRDAKAGTRARAKADREAAADSRKRATAVRDAAADERAYSSAERQANNDIASARADLTNSATERAQIEKDRIEAERQNRNNEIEQQVKQGGLGAGKVAETRKLELQRLNDERAKLETQVVDARERQRVADEALAVASADRSNQVDLLQKQADLTTSLGQRRDLERRILDIQYQEERAKLEGVIASRDTTAAEKEIARRRLASLGQLQQADQAGIDRRNAGPVEQYRERLRAATGDMHEALDSVAANGLQNVEDGLLAIVTGTESVGSAFKRMAASIIADLARIAIQKAVLSAIGGGFLGFADGGKVPGFADGGTPGGTIRGPGTGRSDSILALLKGPGGGAIRVSAGETIVNERASRHWGPVLDAMNRGTLRRFADGGIVQSQPSLNLRAPAVPRLDGIATGRQSSGSEQISLRVHLSDDLHATIDNRAAGVAVEVVKGAAPQLIEASTGHTIARLRQPTL